MPPTLLAACWTSAGDVMPLRGPDTSPLPIRTRIEAVIGRIGEVQDGGVRARVWDSYGRALGFSNPSKAYECLARALPTYREQEPMLLGALLVYMGRIAQVIADRASESERLLDEGAPLVEAAGRRRLRHCPNLWG